MARNTTPYGMEEDRPLAISGSGPMEMPQTVVPLVASEMVSQDICVGLLALTLSHPKGAA